MMEAVPAARAAALPLNGLQALRASAALLVVADHSIETLVEKAGCAIDRSFASFLGDFGVAIFFVISGFIIIHSHGRDFGRAGAPLRFFLKRIGRIVPLYWLVTVIYSLKLVVVGAAPTLGSFLLSLFFIPQQRPDAIYGRPVYELGWTLQYEMAFYITVAIALCLNFRAGIVLVAGVFLTLTSLNGGGYLGSANPLAYLGAPIVLYFLAGVAIAFARQKLNSDSWNWMRPGFWGAILICIFLLAMTMTIHAWFGDGLFPEALTALTAVLATASCAFAVEKPKPSLAKSVSRGLGDSTYSIYLTHSFLLGPSGRIVGKYFEHLPASAFVFLMLPCAALLGLFTYRGIEVPMVKSFSHRLTKLADWLLVRSRSLAQGHVGIRVRQDGKSQRFEITRG